jgi:WD40 repeat protein
MTAAPPPDETAYFPSLASLRAAHADLLKRHREAGEAPETLAAVAAFLQRAQAAGALLDDDDDRRAAQSLLNYWTALLYRAGQEPPEATLADFDPALAPELPDALCPYLGLDAFGEVNSGVFFGRRRLIETLIEHLKTNRLLVVVGPSGSGKSSVVRAGLIPALKAGLLSPESATWHYFPAMVPGSNPLENLAHLTRPPEAEADEWTPGQVAAFQQDDDHLTRLVAAGGPGSAVVVVDQFEEVFTLCADDAVRRAFVDNLVRLSRAPGARHTVILTLRADFESQVTRLPDFEPVFEQAVMRVTPLNAGELREAIEKPAAAIGLKFEAGVVDALLRDILGEPAALPLLQFTLLKLWESRERNRVTWEAYRRLGGGRQALANSADELYRNLITEEQDTAKRLLLRLVRPGEGLEFTSSRVRREALFHKAEARDRVERVLEKFVRARLLRLTRGESEADDQVEVAHEALVRNWPRLVAWLEDERMTMRQRRRLTTAAEQWEALGRDPGALLRGVLLDEALRVEDLNELETAFVQAGLAARQLEEEEKLRAQQQALQAETAQKIAEMERKRASEQARAAWFLRVAFGVAILLFIAAVVLAGRANNNALGAQAANTQSAAALKIAGTALVNADRQAATAVAAQSTAQAASAELVERTEREAAQALSDQAVSNQTTQPDLALLLSVAAYRRQPIAEARSALLGSLSAAPGLLTYLRGHASSGGVSAVAVSPDGALIASADYDGSIILWDAAARQPFGLPLTAGPGPVTSLAFSPDGKMLASGGCAPEAYTNFQCRRGAVRLWDPATGQMLGEPLAGHVYEVYGLAFTPDGETLASGSCAEVNPDYYYECLRGDIILWDVAAREPRGPAFSLPSGNVTTLAVSPDGKTLAAGGNYGVILLLELASGRQIGELLTVRSYYIYSLAFSPDGRMLASTDASDIILWDVDSQQTLGDPLTGHTDWVFSLAFSPDGLTLASGAFDKTIRLWDVFSRAQRGAPLAAHTGAVTGIAFAPDGQTLVSGDRDNNLLMWDLSGAHRLGRVFASGAAPPTDEVAAFSPDGRLLVTSSALFGSGSNPTLRVWDASTGQRLAQLAGHSGGVTRFAFNPAQSGPALASGDEQGTVILWEGITGSEPVIRTFTAYPGEAIFNLAFSPDGSLLATTGGIVGRVLLWDLTASPPVSQTLSGSTYPFIGVAFSPDGETLAAAGCDGLPEEGSEECPGVIRMWNVADRQPRGAPLTGHTNLVFDIAFSPDGQWLASVSLDQTARLWDLTAAAPAGEQLGEAYGWILSVAFSPDGALLATGGCDDPQADPASFPFECAQGGIRLWDVATRESSALQSNTGQIWNVDFSPDGQTLAVSSFGAVPALWDLSRRQPIRYLLDGLPSNAMGLTFADDQTLITIGEYAEVLRWDVDASPPAAPRDAAFLQVRGFTASRTGSALSPDGRYAAVNACLTEFCDQIALQLWDLTATPPISISLVARSTSFFELVFSADSTRLASADIQDIRLWDTQTGELIRTFLESDNARAVALSPNGGRVAAERQSGRITVWNAATGRPLLNLPIETGGSVSSLMFSPDGRLLASGLYSGSIILWDLVTSEQVGQLLVGHTTSIGGFAFSPDGLTLASSDGDGTIRLWAVSPEGHLPLGQALTGHYGSMRLAFSPNGLTLASSGNDLTLRLWDLDPAGWQARACGIAARNFRKAEWKASFSGQPYAPLCASLTPYWGAALEQADAYTASEDTSAEASAAFAEVAQAASQTADYNFNFSVCKTGNQDGQSAPVQPACDRAIGLAVERADIPTLTAACTALAGAALPDAAREFCIRAAAFAAQSEDYYTAHTTCLAIHDAGFAAIALPPCQRAVEFVTANGGADDNKQVCWQQSARKLVKEAEVLRACERAVTLAGAGNASYPREYYLDARGLAYALLGETDKAIQDFEAFVNWAKTDETISPRLLAEREAWLKDLQEERDPFTDETLKAIQNEY